MYKIEEYYHRSEYRFYDIVDLCPNLDYVYEFGIYGGKSMLDLMKQAYLNNKPIKHFIGVDSFVGLPITDNEIVNDWYQGNYSATRLFKISPNECAARIEMLAHLLFPSCTTHIICSLFNELKIDSIIDCKPASFIHIDCDIYSSTQQILEFMTKNKLIVPNTVIRYDDFTSHKEFTHGEGLAHTEWVEKYKVKCSRPLISSFLIESLNYA